jgi:hypothetical protein
MRSNSREIEAIADRASIENVLLTYYHGIDRADYAAIRSCFFEDVSIDCGPFWGPGGLDAYMAYVKGPEALGGYERTMHFAGNMLIDIAGDKARSETYAIAYHTTAPEHEWTGSFVVVYLRYLDRLERRDGIWKILKRTFVVEWIRKEDARDGTWQDLPPEARGRRDREDPFYEL